jgi:hypothetical protein
VVKQLTAAKEPQVFEVTRDRGHRKGQERIERGWPEVRPIKDLQALVEQKEQVVGIQSCATRMIGSAQRRGIRASLVVEQELALCLDQGDVPRERHGIDRIHPKSLDDGLELALRYDRPDRFSSRLRGCPSAVDLVINTD